MELSTSGKRVHASLADPANNAIRSMLRILMGLTDHLDRSRRDLVYNIRDVSSSQAGFAVPDRCEASVDLHLPAQSPVGEIAAELEEVVAATLGEGHEVRDVLAFVTIHAGYEIPDKGWFPEVLREAYLRRGLPWSPGAFRSHSDANLLWAEGIRPVILGPGQLERAHSQDEGVSFDQVAQAAELYLDALHSLSA